MEQARALDAEEPVDAVLNLRVPFEVILDRIKGRWTHAQSGRIYHTEFNPPKVPVSLFPLHGRQGRLCVCVDVCGCV